MILSLLLAAAAIAVAPDAIVWKDGPPTLPAGSKIAVLEGDPRAAGMFTMRVRVPAGAALAPHWHPRDERVTILSGAVELGFGTTADKANTKRYGAGSFYVNPPRAMHYLFFPEETEMQMTGVGPWEIHTTDIVERRDAPASATLTLREIKPVAGSPVNESTTVTAVVDYAIQNFRADTYYFTVQFESDSPGRTFSVDRQKILTSQSGSTTIAHELTHAFGSNKLKRPIRLKVALHELKPDNSNRILASTEWVEYH